MKLLTLLSILTLASCTKEYSAQRVIDRIDTVCVRDTRFGGHLPHFYSVADHSVCCSYNIPDEYALSGLMHDASEAYLMDIPRPIKQKLSNYKEIEENTMVVLSQVFRFQYPLPKEIKERDEYMLEGEWHNRMLGKARMNINSWGEGKRRFLDRFEHLSTLNQ